ncbi:10146_t:CDS:1, partial [Dentiscutata heterogama]
AKINDALIKNDAMCLNQDIDVHSNSFEIMSSVLSFSIKSNDFMSKQLVDEDLNQPKINDALINDEMYLNQDINARSNSSEPNAINKSLPMQDDNILKDKRKQAL